MFLFLTVFQGYKAENSTIFDNSFPFSFYKAAFMHSTPLTSTSHHPLRLLNPNLSSVNTCLIGEAAWNSFTYESRTAREPKLIFAQQCCAFGWILLIRTGRICFQYFPYQSKFTCKCVGCKLGGSTPAEKGNIDLKANVKTNS